MADEALLGAINALNAQIRELEDQARKKKIVVNGLCELAGESPPYPDADAAADKGVVFKPDDFFTKPMATAVTTILERRRQAGLGPASVDDLYDALIQGGYNFQQTNGKQGLSISLSKNSTTFVRLPNGYFGLGKWYDLPKQREKKQTVPPPLKLEEACV